MRLKIRGKILSLCGGLTGKRVGLEPRWCYSQGAEGYWLKNVQAEYTTFANNSISGSKSPATNLPAENLPIEPLLFTLLSSACLIILLHAYSPFSPAIPNHDRATSSLLSEHHRGTYLNSIKREHQSDATAVFSATPYLLWLTISRSAQYSLCDFGLSRTLSTLSSLEGRKPTTDTDGAPAVQKE